MRQTDFAGKKRLALLTVTKGFDLGFDGRVVYSSLVFMTRFGKAHREGQIAAYLDDDSIRIPSAVSGLVEAGLVGRSKDGLRALEPTGDRARWFAWQSDRSGKPWHRCFRYVMAYLPSKKRKITFRELLLYATICALADDDGLAVGQSKNGLVALTRMSRPTVVGGLDILRDLGLIDFDDSGKGLNILVTSMDSDHSDWLEDKRSESKVDIEDIRRRLQDQRKARLESESDKIELAEVDEYDINNSIVSEEMIHAVHVPGECPIRDDGGRPGDGHLRSSLPARSPERSVDRPLRPAFVHDRTRIEVSDKERRSLAYLLRAKGIGEDILPTLVGALGLISMPNLREWTDLANKSKDAEELMVLVRTFFVDMNKEAG